MYPVQVQKTECKWRTRRQHAHEWRRRTMRFANNQGMFRAVALFRNFLARAPANTRSHPVSPAAWFVWKTMRTLCPLIPLCRHSIEFITGIPIKQPIRPEVKMMTRKSLFEHEKLGWTCSAKGSIWSSIQKMFFRRQNALFRGNYALVLILVDPYSGIPLRKLVSDTIMAPYIVILFRI